MNELETEFKETLKRAGINVRRHMDSTSTEYDKMFRVWLIGYRHGLNVMANASVQSIDSTNLTI